MARVAPSGHPGRHRPGEVAVAPIDWLRHTLVVGGPSVVVAAFEVAACGSGLIPWPLDADAEEARLLAPMAAGGHAARALARDLREAVEANHHRLLAQVGRGGGCLLDLCRLLPPPQAVLAVGPGHLTSDHWLRTRWGTVHPLRRVRALDRTDRRLRRGARVVFGFESADWTPWQAILGLRGAWPALAFDVRPDYGGGYS